MSSLSSLNRRLDKIEAMIPAPEPGTPLDLSLLSAEERGQLQELLASLPPGGTIKDVSDDQLRTLSHIVGLYKPRETRP